MIIIQILYIYIFSLATCSCTYLCCSGGGGSGFLPQASPSIPVLLSCRTNRPSRASLLPDVQLSRSRSRSLSDDCLERRPPSLPRGLLGWSPPKASPFGQRCCKFPESLLLRPGICLDDLIPAPPICCMPPENPDSCAMILSKRALPTPRSIIAILNKSSGNGDALNWRAVIWSRVYLDATNDSSEKSNIVARAFHVLKHIHRGEISHFIPVFPIHLFNM